MKKNKKGFTLVELLAVLVVLIIIIVLAVIKIKKSVDESVENTVKANALTFVKAVNNEANASRLTNKFTDGNYTIAQLYDMGISLSGTKPESGEVLIISGKVLFACMVYEKRTALYNNGELTLTKDNSCSENDYVKVFGYTGTEEVFTASLSGVYKIEAWGAQGGDSYYNSYHEEGGYGGYSVGSIFLNEGEKLYINVGGKGKGINYEQSSGTRTYDDGTGYNGGGFATSYNDNSSHGGGGGATSIAFSTGLLKNLNTTKYNVLMVAGAGGGASTHSSYPSYSGKGGSGGGYIGGSGVPSNPTCYNYGNGGTQTAGGSFTACTSDGRTNRPDNPPVAPSFGLGSSHTANNTSNTYAGGGAGYFGGQSGWHAPGGGGSGYIGYPQLYDKYMICYNCETSGDDNTMTQSNTCAEDIATSDCSKKGNGAVKITYISAINENEDDIESGVPINFGFIGREQIYEIKQTGDYKLEVWGAQGGSYNSTYYGGYGGYSTGVVHLNKGDKLYLNIGGSGTVGSSSSVIGGYNGGGNAYSSNHNVGSGGGATSIATISGKLNTLGEYKDSANTFATLGYYSSNEILIVAGGGGGSYFESTSNYGPGGSGGGYFGGDSSQTVSGRSNKYIATGGSQVIGGTFGRYYNSSYPGLGDVSNGSFGLGGTNSDTGSDRNIPGGGGGFFGGAATVQGSASGGSGYIGNTKLSDKEMYCYNCTESSDERTKTTTTTCTNASATENCAKMGDGYARITLID